MRALFQLSNIHKPNDRFVLSRRCVCGVTKALDIDELVPQLLMDLALFLLLIWEKYHRILRVCVALSNRGLTPPISMPWVSELAHLGLFSILKAR